MMLVVSDLHAHAWSRFATTTADGRNSRFEDLMNVLRQVGEIADEFQADTLAILGDLTHQRFFVRFSIYTPLLQWLAEQRRRRRVIVLKGNHDEETATTHALGPLALTGIDVIDTPKYLEQLGVPTLWVPYMDGETLASVVRERRADQIFLHYALDGKVMTGGEYALTSPLRLSDLDGYERIVLGHVHAPAVEQDGRVIYVGAPLHFDFGDSGDRYCWLFPDGNGAPRAFKLRAPKFVTTTYPRIGVAPMEHSGFLRVLNTPANLFEDVKREALAQGWLDCIAIEERMPDEAVRVLSSAIMADEAVVRGWVERQYANLSADEREPIITFGLDCLREAQR